MQELVHALPQSAALSQIRQREGERKLAQTADFCASGESWQTALGRTKAAVVVLGIPSDIGVRANFGKPGCSNLWAAARAKFLSMQDNAALRGESLLVLGEIAVDDLMRKAATLDATRAADLAALHALVCEVDERVAVVAEEVVKSGKVLVAVGGGHENAFGIIKGLSTATSRGVSCINIDAHADLRQDAGRHSGNAFSAARREKFLRRYCVMGLQEPFVNDAMWEQLCNEKDVRAITLESMRTRLIMVSAKLRKFPQAWPHAPHLEACEEAAKFVKKLPLALEMDLDAITCVAASAPTRAGLAVEEVREMLRYIGVRRDVHTFHICEGIADETDSQGVGALTALLMSDVIKTVLARHAK
ncbi:MAG: hypothetical protein EXS12_03125 [Phycisphaerales bacterium]|nr:hypothetical protein [Phycisphaerales bacterium]